MEATRRDFVVGGAAAVAAAAVASQAAYAMAQEVSEEPSWDYEADVVVVGAGTGLLAAFAAAKKGLKVALLEVRGSTGGAMKYSGGNAWLANTSISAEGGDSYELSKVYLDHMQLGMDNEELVEAYLANTQKVVDLFNDNGLGLKGLPRNGQYQPDWEGADCIGRSCQVMGDNDGSDISEDGGYRLWDALQTACDEAGVDTLLNTRGRSLIVNRADANAVPEVVGIVATDADGNELRIKAGKGVILATGGFEWNKKLCDTFVRVPLYGGISFAENVGDGLYMAQSVGAELSLMTRTFGMPNFKAHYDYARENGGMVSMAGNADRSLPGSIIVDRTARRFGREDSGYMSFNNCFGGYLNFGDEGYACDPAWWICDGKAYEEAGGVNGAIESWGYPVCPLPEEDFVYSADTIEDLAGLIGLDPQQLRRTVDEWNEHAAEGKDPLYHRGEVGTAGQPANPLACIENGPFYAAAITAGCCGTVGGPRLNGHAQVMHVTGVPVEGLYAMGNCAGVGGPGVSYGGEGGTIGPAFTFGVIAVEHMAAER